MSRSLLVGRVPSPLWRVFRLALLRESLSMQAWLERAVHHSLEVGSSRRAGHQREKRPNDNSVPKARGESLKYVVARVPRDDLAKLRRLLRAGGIQLNEWLIGEVERYVKLQRGQSIDALSPQLVELLLGVMGGRRDMLRDVAHILLGWPERVITEAVSDPVYAFRDALRRGNKELLSEILEVAAMNLEVRERIERLSARVRELGLKVGRRHPR